MNKMKTKKSCQKKIEKATHIVDNTFNILNKSSNSKQRKEILDKLIEAEEILYEVMNSNFFEDETEEEPKECNVCHGRGHTMGRLFLPETCPVCNGSGVKEF